MDRNELHQQILELADKIGHLNDTLSRSKRVHPVEIDLLRLYVRELVAGTEELAEMSGMPREVFAVKQEVVAVPTITEPVNLEELSAVPAAPEKAITVAEPIATPPIEQEKIAEPIAENIPEVPPMPEKEPDVVTEKAAFNPIFVANESPEKDTVEVPEKSTVSTPEPETPKEAEKEIPKAQPVPDIVEESFSPPPRRQVNMQQEPNKPENKYVTPAAGASVTALHSIEEEPEAPSINDRFAQQSDLFNNTKHTDGKGLKEMMDLGERFLFMKELFGGDLAAFDRATDALNGIISMEQARAYMEGVLRQTYNWEGKEPIVRQFYNLLEQRFKN